MIWTRLVQVFFIGGVAYGTVLAVRALCQDWRNSRG
jgi:hypothetical protein